MLLIAPCVLHAEEPLRLERERPPGVTKPQQFMPLDSVRAAQKSGKGMVIGNEKKAFVLRTDREQVQKGFIRIDRNRSRPMPVEHAVVKPVVIAPDAAKQQAVAPESEEMESASVEAASLARGAPGDGTADQESEEIVGNTESHDPVLALFDAGEDDDLLSFAEAMRGERTPSGRKRHLVWPVPLSVAQTLSSGYGMRTDPFHGRPAFHGGIDIAAPVGTPVLATADGQVMQVQSDVNYGKYVTIQHADGTLSRYGHLSAQGVTLGQQVRAGQQVGKIGATGRATGAHLDYRVSKNGMKFDPLAILRIPPEVEYKGIRPVAVASSAPAVSVRRIASKPLPKQPMVIKVQ